MKKILYLLAVLSFLLGFFFIYKGFDKKMNYQKPKRYSNSYVGGDAYNYIINSNYFTGYNVLGIGCYVITVLGLTGAAILDSLDKSQEQSKQFYVYIREHPMFSNSGIKADNGLKQKGEGFSIGEWGQLPNISGENADHNFSSQTTNTNPKGSSQLQLNINNGQNHNKVQNSQFYPYPHQQMPSEQRAHAFQQNQVTNPPMPNFNYGQNFGNASVQDSQNDNYSQVSK